MIATAQFNFSDSHAFISFCMFVTAQPHRLTNTWSLMDDVQAECSHAVHVAEAVMGTPFCTGVQCSTGNPCVVHAHSIASNPLD